MFPVHGLEHQRLKKYFNVYLFLRESERQHEWERGRDRGRQKNPKQASGLGFSTEPDTGLELLNCEIVI